jgi:oligopeptide/dipeptide ABC transporter ATP-binding protein
MSDYVGVMYLGRLVEAGPAERIFSAPEHPYTRLLMDTVPDITMGRRNRAPVIGEVPNPITPPPGCSFNPRCPLANDRCRAQAPEARKRAGGSIVACHAVEEGRDTPETVACETGEGARMQLARGAA